MYEETIQDLKEKRYIISEFIKEAIDSLISEADKNIGYDDGLVEFNNGYIEKLSSLNIELIQEWQDNLPNIVNVEYDTIYTKYSLRRVIIRSTGKRHLPSAVNVTTLQMEITSEDVIISI